jgi:hypothetical protein
MLEAPNGEIVVAYYNEATSWGVLGTWEWVVHISEFPINQLGIYHWKLCYGDDLLLDRPMLVSRQVGGFHAEPGAPPDRGGSSGSRD